MLKRSSSCGVSSINLGSDIGLHIWFLHKIDLICFDIFRFDFGQNREFDLNKFTADWI